MNEREERLSETNPDDGSSCNELLGTNSKLPQTQWLKHILLSLFILLSFWRCKIDPTGLKTRRWPVCTPSEGLEKNLFLSLFWLPEAAHIPWLISCLHLQSQQMSGQVFLTLHHSDTDSPFSPFYFERPPCDYIGPSWVIRDTLPISRFAEQWPSFHLQC